MWSFKNFKVVLLLALTIIALQSFTTKLLPKVYVIGDSISIHYGPYLKTSLEGFFSYDRKRDKGEAIKDLDHPVGANGGDSGMVLAYLKELKDSTDFKTDYLLVNCGLHDIKRKSPNDSTQISLKKYKDNLQSIITISKDMKVKLVWVRSTPVVDSIHNKRVPFFRFEKDLITYNKAADSIMHQAHIPIIDLFTFTKKYIPDAYLDHIHYKKEIREKQADFIAGSLSAIFNCNQED
ncbi:SGNH/GDSL hydrolase family protein [Yeosuana marina]|uniref:SGNH/GDSL hydrolase family protein n=1 Tax=Yeosuana marina TaxID=1565536 RepID=UPI0014226769|nr:SGNH/GDSL hydrolase family protein [Yeosuana marina]